MTPAISVIIPLYNKRPYIARAVESVFAQTFADFELIVVDDGSTDGGAAELEPYQADSRLRIVCQQNAGGGAARNRGMRESHAPLIAFLDADDEFLPTHLEALQSLAERFPEAGLLATGYHAVSANGSRSRRPAPGPAALLLDDYFAAACRYRYFLAPSACAVRRVAVAAVGAFLEGVPIGEDLEYWARIALQFPIAYDPRPSALYYLGVPGSALSGSRWNSSAPVVARMLTEWLARKGRSHQAKSVTDYAAWVLLNHVAVGISALHRREAKQVLRHPLVRRSRFRLRRILLWLAASFTTDRAMRAYFRFRRACATGVPTINRIYPVLRAKAGVR